jgi:hypothetical protein
MRIYTFECEITCRTSLEDTFRIFENPYNLAKLTPSGLGFRVLTENAVMRKGLEIDYEFRWLGLPLRWKTLITEYEPPFLFVDEAVKSPYALWRHRHEFRAVERGTVVADRVDYALPFGLLGQAVQAAVVGRQVKEIFAFRQRTIQELTGGLITQSTA